MISKLTIRGRDSEIAPTVGFRVDQPNLRARLIPFRHLIAPARYRAREPRPYGDHCLFGWGIRIGFLSGFAIARDLLSFSVISRLIAPYKKGTGELYRARY